jgi:dienelactone hydrolase
LRLETRKRIILPVVLLAVAALVFVLGYLLPTRLHVERATYIEVAPEVVYGLVNDLSQFEHWTPWYDRDPAIRYQAASPQRGLGATLHWEAEDSGAGSVSIIDAQPYASLRLLLEEGGDQAVLAFQFEPLEKGTHIVWTLDAEQGSNPLSRYQGWLAERRLKARFETGLNRLRLLSEAQPVLPPSQLVTQEIKYKVDGKPFTGYLAYDQNRSNRPGILLVHDRWGPSDSMRKRAEQLGGLGYTAFALDLYGGGKPPASAEQAEQLAGEIIKHPKIAQQRIQAALDVLKDQAGTDRERLAAVGYGLGGTLALQMARMGMTLDGVVSFYGDLTPHGESAAKGKVAASILVLNGAADKTADPHALDAFMQEMDGAGVDYEFMNYPNVGYGFADPVANSDATAYNADADKNSWQKMQAFLARVFG